MIRLHWLCASLSETTEGLAFLTATVRHETGPGQEVPAAMGTAAETSSMKQTRRAASQLVGALPPR